MNRATATGLPRSDLAGLVAWGALVALQILWHGWLATPRHAPTIAALAFFTVPLLLPLFALPRVRRALLWTGMLALFYFCHGVAEAFSAPAERAMALLEIVLTVLLIGMLGAGGRRQPAR